MVPVTQVAGSPVHLPMRSTGGKAFDRGDPAWGRTLASALAPPGPRGRHRPRLYGIRRREGVVRAPMRQTREHAAEEIA